MKKTFLLPLHYLSLALNIQAQLLQIGVKAGLNYANFSGTEIQTDAITSYQAGLIAEIKLLGKICHSARVACTPLKAQPTTPSWEMLKMSWDILLFPFLAKIYLGKSFS